MSDVMRAVGQDEPVMQAWTKHSQTEAHTNSVGWIGKHADIKSVVDGALWATFLAGFNAALGHAAALHESVNSASDQKRFDKSPGAGAMGAIIEYRDLIRQAAP